MNRASLVERFRRRVAPAGRSSAATNLDLEVDPETHLMRMADRWDKEWIQYFSRAPEYFEDCSAPTEDTRARLAAVEAAQGREFSGERGPIDSKNPVWGTWAIAAYPDEVHNKRVADLGCGPGGIGRTLGYVADKYLGLDYSPLALYVAQVISPSNCTYIPRYQEEEIAEWFGTLDVVFSRSVFIHQNFEEATSLAGLAAKLLRPGGVLAADFFRPDKDMSNPKERGLSRFAKDGLDPDRPTVGFVYTEEEWHELAGLVGLEVEAIIPAPERHWTIVRFRKPAA